MKQTGQFESAGEEAVAVYFKVLLWQSPRMTVKTIKKSVEIVNTNIQMENYFPCRASEVHLQTHQGWVNEDWHDVHLAFM
jgi:hypothetical protein